MVRKKYWSKVWEKLTTTYRLVLLNDETFEEVGSFQLTRMNVYILVSTVLVAMVLITVTAIVYTPLKEYIPGYTDVNVQRNLIALKLRVDSLELAHQLNVRYTDNLRRIIAGELKVSQFFDTSQLRMTRYDTIQLGRISQSEKELRSEIERIERFAILNNPMPQSKEYAALRALYFFRPVRSGYVTQGFDLSKQHYGVDIVSVENEPIKAVLDGTVVFSGFTAETGYVIGIQHLNNLISIYKHNSALLKRMGDRVRAGDVIAIIGNTGEYTTGPHLHLEIWHNGNPVDPRQLISLE